MSMFLLADLRSHHLDRLETDGNRHHQGNPQQDSGNRPGHEGRYPSLTEGQRPVKGVFHDGTQHQADDEGGARDVVFLHEIADNAEQEHDPDVEDIGVERVNTDHANENDDRIEDTVRNAEAQREERDHGEIHDEQDDVSYEHAGDQGPDEIG